jgi:glycosyltransferase involved in cell wall biosynthesis
VIVSTYNRPDALALVLDALRRQDTPPHEVIVADDGSGAETAALVASVASTYPVPLRHVWHPDAGFRAGAIRNRAIAVARGAYILQLDGDIVLHPAAVRRHLAFAKAGSFVQGSRALLDRRLTEELLRTGRLRTRTFERGVGHRHNSWYLPMLSAFGTRASRDPLVRVRGCHVAFWRADALRVNGYNEAMTGWGLEDSEFVARLQHAGVRRRTLKFAAVAWHLWHDERSRAAVPVNRAIYDETIATRATRCALGISAPTTEVAPPPLPLSPVAPDAGALPPRA